MKIKNILKKLEIIYSIVATSISLLKKKIIKKKNSAQIFYGKLQNTLVKTSHLQTYLSYKNILKVL